MHVRVLCSLLRPPVRLSLPPMVESTVSGVYCLIIYSDHIPLPLVDHNRTTHGVAEIAAGRQGGVQCMYMYMYQYVYMLCSH